ncbi:MAG: hypothetical protein JWP11_3802 [Frankiales bacterium]|nr:hypothetical protein [Frankiales bacterium]
MTKITALARNRYAQAVAYVLALFASAASPAMATETDPLNGGGDAIFTTLTDYLTTSLVGKVFALAVVSIAIGLVLRWVRKAVHA